MRVSAVSAVRMLVAGIFLAACSTAPSGPAGPSGDPGASGLYGRVVTKDGSRPAAGAHVYAYRDLSKSLIGVSDFASGPADAEGNYRFELPPGRYGVAARRRESGSPYGPISTGDEYDNRPGEGMVEVRAGGFTRVDFTLLAMREPMFFKRGPGEVSDTGVRGRIADEKGAPVAGAFAIAYAGSDMKRLPGFASMVTGPDGTFVLYLPAGGRYRLGARVHVRDMPQTDEPYAAYEGAPDHSLDVPQGKFVDKVDLVLRPFKGVYQPGRVLY